MRFHSYNTHTRARRRRHVMLRVKIQTRYLNILFGHWYIFFINTFTSPLYFDSCSIYIRGNKKRFLQWNYWDIHQKFSLKIECIVQRTLFLSDNSLLFFFSFFLYTVYKRQLFRSRIYKHGYFIIDYAKYRKRCLVYSYTQDKSNGGKKLSKNKTTRVYVVHRIYLVCVCASKGERKWRGHIFL